MCALRYGAILLGAALICLTVGAQGAAQQNYDDESTPEGWAWALIKQGKEANFDLRCHTLALDPKKDDDRWNDDCRRLSAAFISDVLLREPWRGQIPARGINIAGARLEEDLDLQNSKLDRSLSINRSRIGHNINLNRARTDSIISFDRSRVAGKVWANEFRSQASLWLRSTEFDQDVLLSYASIDINLDMVGAIFNGALDANSARIGGNLLMLSTEQTTTTFKKTVSLTGAKIDGLITMDGATVEGTLNADSLHVGAHLFMRSTEALVATFNDVILRSSKIDGQVSLTGALIKKSFNANSMRIGSHLFMQSMQLGDHQATFNKTNLAQTQVAGQVSLDGALLNDDMNAVGLQVGADLYMRATTSTHAIDFRFARVSGNIETHKSTLASLNLSGASMGNLSFGNVENATHWKNETGQPGKLDLRNARVSNLVDAPSGAWPDPGHLYLAGFTFSHLGEVEGQSGSEKSGRGPAGWDEWLKRDPTYHPSSYEQVAAAFTAAGDRAGADEIRYLSRIRQREVTTAWWPRFSSYVFQYTAGFGIGDYTFLVLAWVIGISLVGAGYLRVLVPAGRGHGFVWCCGASLSRLLPIIEINREFTDFFNDPERKRLSGRDTFVFSVIAMVGWLLGAILIAAVSGLVPKG